MIPGDSGKAELERLKKLVDAAVTTLGDHFDSVHVFCTLHENSEVGTGIFDMGTGNWFARYGQVKAWVLAEEKRLAECGQDEDDDGDD